MKDIDIMYIIAGVLLIAFCSAMLMCVKLTGNKKRYYVRAAIPASLYAFSALLHFVFNIGG